MKNTSIQRKIWTSFSSVLLLGFLLVGIIVPALVRHYAKQTAAHNAAQILTLVSDSMNERIHTVNEISKQLILNSDVQKYCEEAENLSEYQRVMMEYRLRKGIMSDVLYSNDLISGIVIFPARGYCLSFGENQFMPTEQYQTWPVYKESLLFQKPCWFGSRTIKAAYGNQSVISMTRPFFVGSDENNCCIIEIQVPAEQMITWPEKFTVNQDADILIFDVAGREALWRNSRTENASDIYHAVQKKIKARADTVMLSLKDGKFLAADSMLDNGWKMVYLHHADTLAKTSDAVIFVILCLVVLMIGASLVLSRVLSVQLVKPIKEAIITTGTMYGRVETEGKESEITELLANYNEMIERVRDSELETLRAQITPHFLYNTLNSIKCQAALDDDVQVEHMTQWLITLLELSIKNNSPLIPLRKELEMLDSYVNLQKACSDKDFFFFLDVAQEKLQSCLIPKMVLQTIVENAILHGIDDRNGIIHVSCKQTGDDVSITVWDNGIGMPEELIREVLAGKHSDKSRQMNHIGIYNVDQRIKASYGQKYGIDIKSTMGKGTTVMLTIPLVIPEQEEQENPQ